MARGRWVLLLLALCSYSYCSCCDATTAKDHLSTKEKRQLVRDEEERALVLNQYYDESEKPSTHLFLVVTIDGKVHALDMDKGKPVWSSPIGSSAVSSFSSLDGSSLVVGDAGELYFKLGEEYVEYNMTIPEIVDEVPLLEDLGNGNVVTIVGEKTTTVVSMDAKNGSIVMVASSGNGETAPVTGEDSSEVLMLGRIDYRVRAFDMSSNTELWNITYSQFDLPGSASELSVRGQVMKRATFRGLPVKAMFTASKLENEKAWEYLSLNSYIVAPTLLEDDSWHQGRAAHSLHVKQFFDTDGRIQVYATPHEEKPLDSSFIGVPRLPGGDIGDETMGKYIVPFDQSVFGLVKTLKPKLSTPRQDEDILQGPKTIDEVDSSRACPVGTFPFIPSERTEQKQEAGDDLQKDAVPSWFPMQEVLLFSGGGFFMALVTAAMYLWKTYGSPPIAKIETYGRESWVDENTLVIGNLTVNMNDIRGRGCHGTVVYSGRLGKRPVAIKRMLSSLYKVANKEVDLLIRSDGHNNVVRYFAQEKNRDFVYLALELCTTTLDRAILETKKDVKTCKSPADCHASTTQFLQDVSEACLHLHKLNIVHCDIKPQNILVVERKVKGFAVQRCCGLGHHWIPKISDMGLGKKVSDGSSSLGSFGTSLGVGTTQQSFMSSNYSSIHGGAGTVGWRAPEILLRLSNRDESKEENEDLYRLGSKVDVFSLGCVFFYALTGGHHPFGDNIYEREKRIINGTPSIESVKELSLEAHDLISRMVAKNPSDRPSLDQVVAHPLFWSAEKKLNLISLVSDRLKAEKPATTQLRRLLETHAEKVIGHRKQWFDRLDKLVQEEIEQTTHTYDFFKLTELIRFIRNKRSHVQEIKNPGLRSRVDTPEKFFEQFLKPFPLLTLTCFHVIKQACAHEPEFQSFFPDDTRTANSARQWLNHAIEAEKKEKLLERHRGWYIDEHEWSLYIEEINVKQSLPSKNNAKKSGRNQPGYKFKLCKHFERTKGQWCAKGKACGFAHGKIELRRPQGQLVINGVTSPSASTRPPRHSRSPPPRARPYYSPSPPPSSEMDANVNWRVK